MLDLGTGKPAVRCGALKSPILSPPRQAKRSRHMGLEAHRGQRDYGGASRMGLALQDGFGSIIMSANPEIQNNQCAYVAAITYHLISLGLCLAASLRTCFCPFLTLALIQANLEAVVKSVQLLLFHGKFCSLGFANLEIPGEAFLTLAYVLGVNDK